MTFLLCNTHQQCRDTNMNQTAHFLPLPLIHSFGATGACRKRENQCRREKDLQQGYNKCLLKLKCVHAKYFNKFKNQRDILNQEICIKAKRKYHYNGSKQKKDTFWFWVSNSLDTILESWKRSKMFKRYGIHIVLKCAGV